MEPVTIRSGEVFIQHRTGGRRVLCSPASWRVTISEVGVHVTITDGGTTESEWLPWHAVEGVEWVRKVEDPIQEEYDSWGGCPDCGATTPARLLKGE